MRKLKFCSKKWKFVAEGWRGKIYKKKCRGVIFAKKVAKEKEKIGAINKEARILEFINIKGLDFVPKLIKKGKGFFVYCWIEGKFFENVQINQKILLDLIQKAYLLDKIGVFHGELDKPTKNVLLDKNGEIKIIDFDRGKILETKLPKNLRAVAQFLHNLGILEVEDLKKIGKIKDIQIVKKKLVDKVNKYGK